MVNARRTGDALMHVVIRRYTLAGSSEELMRRAREEILPVIKALPGFRAFHVADCGGSVMSISFWDSKPEATRSTEVAREWVQRSAIGLVPFPPEVVEGDTVLDLT
jgi:heme-degrading monooxygenase HmoA